MQHCPVYTGTVAKDGKTDSAQLCAMLKEYLHVYAAPEIAIDDLSSLESEFLALQHSVQK